MPVEQRKGAGREAARGVRRRRGAVGGVLAAVVLVVAVVVAIAVQSSRTAPSATAATPANTVGDGYTIALGQASAPVTVDLYEDLQCPNCKAFEAANGHTLAQLVAAGTVQLHHHPMAFLDSSANQQYSTRALDAAAAVLDAAGPDAFQRFHDLIYAAQPPETGPGLTDDQLVAYAQQAGATGEQVEQEIRGLAFGEWAAASTDRASQDGVTGTPTVLVDGTRVTDLSAAGLTAAVQAAVRTDAAGEDG